MSLTVDVTPSASAPTAVSSETDGGVSSVDGDAGEHMGLLLTADGRPLPSATAAAKTAAHEYRTHRQRTTARERVLIGGGGFAALLLLLLALKGLGAPPSTRTRNGLVLSRRNGGSSSRHHPPSLTRNKAGASKQHAPPPPPVLAPPPEAPFPPIPPFPHAPPLQLASEPSVLGTCGHLAIPVDTTGRVPYPGGAWQYFAEWSGLDDQAAGRHTRRNKCDCIQEKSRHMFRCLAVTGGAHILRRAAI